MRVESASSIQKVDSNDLIVAFQRDAADFFDSFDTAAQQPLVVQSIASRTANEISFASNWHSHIEKSNVGPGGAALY